jgi:hypothetical protein
MGLSVAEVAYADFDCRICLEHKAEGAEGLISHMHYAVNPVSRAEHRWCLACEAEMQRHYAADLAASINGGGVVAAEAEVETGGNQARLDSIATHLRDAESQGYELRCPVCNEPFSAIELVFSQRQPSQAAPAPEKRQKRKKAAKSGSGAKRRRRAKLEPKKAKSPEGAVAAPVASADARQAEDAQFAAMLQQAEDERCAKDLAAQQDPLHQGTDLASILLAEQLLQEEGYQLAPFDDMPS